MKTKNKATFLFLCIAFTLSTAAAAAQQREDSRDERASGVGISGIRWEPIGQAKLRPRSKPAETVTIPVPGKPPKASAGRPDEVVLRGVNIHEGTVYRVAVPARELARLSRVVHQLGIDRGAVSDGSRRELAEVVEPASLAKGWSLDHDSRIRFTNTTEYPFRAIGTLYDGSGDCTGTRIGRRIVLTAAHCIYNRATDTWASNFNFKPGRNGEASAPYGSSGPHWYWVPDDYWMQPDGVDVNRWDIAVVVLDQAVGNGWMGYAALSGSSLTSKDLRMRGYPRCNTAGAPNGCDPKTLWGDTKLCDLGTFFSPDSDGWNREITTNCDGSDGQSGSSFYYNTSDGLAATIGVFSGHYCLGACAPAAEQYDAYPNVITRITPEYLDVINWFQAEYP